MDDIKTFLTEKRSLIPLLPAGITIDEMFPVGGQGVVYRGALGATPAAIKIYFPGQLQVRIDREIRALSMLNNPHIVKLLWSDKLSIGDEELPIVATELIAGTDLATCLRHGPLPHDQIGPLIFDLADAIDAMWNIRVVHRDIKPSNILIRTDGRASLIDLGVARHIDRTPLTAIGSTWGTNGYMSPEQAAAARQLTCKSDIYGLGVVAVESALGRHPTRRNQEVLLGMGFHERLPSELAGWQHADLVRSMVHVRPTRRPTPQEIKRLLAEYER
jgi:serine/threonine protein kinase